MVLTRIARDGTKNTCFSVRDKLEMKIVIETLRVPDYCDLLCVLVLM